MIEVRVGPRHVALVDDADYRLVAGRLWEPWISGNVTYARTRPHRRWENGRRVNGPWVSMHRMLLTPADDVIVDHRNRNGLDNRRENLRLCNHSENMRNRAVNGNKKAGTKGVFFLGSPKRARPWRAIIGVDGRSIELGYYETEAQAHAAYCEAAKQYHGEFARTD